MSEETYTDETKRAERDRIADWLEERAKLVMHHDQNGARELAVAASVVRLNKLDILQRDGGHGDDR